MTSTRWGHETLPNLELWDDLNWIVAQWICQECARKTAAPGNHIEDAAVDDWPCDCCFDEAVEIVNGGFRELLQIHGSRAYACGLEGVPENEAARRTLHGLAPWLRPMNQKGRP